MEIDLYSYTSCIGPNNSGKSTVLSAIHKFLEQTKITDDDFRKGAEEEIVIAGEFTNIEKWERETPGVAGLVYNNSIQLRLIAEITESDSGRKIEQRYESFTQDETIDGYNEKWGEVSEQIKTIASTVDVNTGTHWKTKNKRELVKQKIRDSHAELIAYGDPKWSSENISIKEALKQALPAAIIIPAVRDASDETKPSQNTALTNLMNLLIFPEIQRSEDYREFLTALAKLQDRLGGNTEKQLPGINKLAQDISKRISEIVSATVKFGMDDPDTEKILNSNAYIRIDDGFETKIQYQGHGVQRALIFALIESIAKQNTLHLDGEHSRAILLLFEEPELFLHPHLMRRLRQSLEKMAATGPWQIIVSTHSPFLIEVANNPKSLVLFRKNDPMKPPYIKQPKVDPFEKSESSRDDRLALRAALDFHPTVTEAFFANQVVLVEGDTELGILSHSDELYKKFDITEEIYNKTTIISCGGKWTIPAIARVLVSLHIPFRIIHDLDKKGLSEQELSKLPAIDPYNANKRISDAAVDNKIYLTEDTFEDVLNISGTSDKPYRSWKKLQEEIGENLKEKYPKLNEIFKFAFDWDGNDG